MEARAYGRAAAWVLTALLAAMTAGGAAAQRGPVVIPENTVVRLELAEDVNSRAARVGDRVTARLDENDRSGFPVDTRFEGTVTEARRADDRPAILDMEFQRAILPGGAAVPLRGDLVSLAEDETRVTADGRLESRRRGNFDWKWVGYGAAGGAVLGEIFGDELLKGALLGGLGGAIYSYLNRDRDRGYGEVALDRGTEFGVRLDRRVAFNNDGSYRYSNFPQTGDRVLGSRDALRVGDTEVFVNGRAAALGELRPMQVNGIFYVPLRPVAEASGWRLQHTPGADQFVFVTPSGSVRGTVDDVRVITAGRTQTLHAAPLNIGGEVYVPLEYFGRGANMGASWDRQARRLDLYTDRNARVLGYREARALRPVTMSRLVANLAAANYERIRANAPTYRIVDIEEVLTPAQASRLQGLINENSAARRQRNLLTNFLRDTNRITNQQTVVGISEADRVIYVQ